MLHLDLHDLHEILLSCSPNAEGWVVTKIFLLNSANKYDCAELTIRNFVNKKPEFFEHKHGLIRMKMEEVGTTKEQEASQEEFTRWLKEREDLLTEILVFLGTQPLSPYIENLFAQISAARDELKAYDDSKLASLLSDVQREFGFVASKALVEV